MNTFLYINKPAGWTSFDCVAVVRRKLGTKKVGHTGTLDPFATGLLIIAVGKCTKLIPYLEKDRKTYRTKILFNKTSETLDTESEVELVARGLEIVIREAELQKVLEEQFSGVIDQIPPKYSALKIDGKRAYDLAREGVEFEMKVRKAEVLRTEILAVGADWCELEIEVAAGFYVRSFARDVARELGTTGMCGELRRIGIGDKNIEVLGDKVLDPEQLKEPNYQLQTTSYIDPREILPQLKVIEIDKERLPDWSHGRAIKLSNENTGEVLVTVNDKTIGLGLLGQGSLQPKVVF